MTERQALERVEDVYGSVEQFALHILTEAPAVLDSSKAITLRASEASLEPMVLNFLLTQSQAFRRLMRQVMVNQSFDLASEHKHIEMVKTAATNSKKKEVVTPRGFIAEVDHSPDEVMKAGEYLNKYRGTPLNSGETQRGPSLIINFGGPMGGDGDEKTLTVEGSESPTGFKRLRAGGLPPPGAQKRFSAGEGSPGERHALTREGSELDLYSEEAKSKARNPQIDEPGQLSERSDSVGGNNRTDEAPDWTEKW